MDASANGEKMSSSVAVIPDDFGMATSAFDIPRIYKGDLSCVIIPGGMIVDRVRRMAEEINDIIGDEPLTVLCVLKGGYKFFTILVDALTAARVSCSHQLNVEFIRCSSYEDTQSTGSVKIIGLSNLNDMAAGNNILVVEDIVDTGRTLCQLLQMLKDAGAKSTWTATLASKRVTRTVKVPEDFIAFSVPDQFIVGFGLDYNQAFRNVRHVCMMSEQGVEKYKNASP